MNQQHLQDVHQFRKFIEEWLGDKKDNNMEDFKKIKIDGFNHFGFQFY